MAYNCYISESYTVQKMLDWIQNMLACMQLLKMGKKSRLNV